MPLATDEELNSLTEMDLLKYLNYIKEYNFTNYDAETFH